jgi:hypothetical protein
VNEGLLYLFIYIYIYSLTKGLEVGLVFECNNAELKELSSFVCAEKWDLSDFRNAICLLKYILNCESIFHIWTWINCSQISEGLLCSRHFLWLLAWALSQDGFHQAPFTIAVGQGAQRKLLSCASQSSALPFSLCIPFSLCRVPKLHCHWLRNMTLTLHSKEDSIHGFLRCMWHSLPWVAGRQDMMNSRLLLHSSLVPERGNQVDVCYGRWSLSIRELLSSHKMLGMWTANTARWSCPGHTLKGVTRLMCTVGDDLCPSENSCPHTRCWGCGQPTQQDGHVLDTPCREPQIWD